MLHPIGSLPAALDPTPPDLTCGPETTQPWLVPDPNPAVGGLATMDLVPPWKLLKEKWKADQENHSASEITSPKDTWGESSHPLTYGEEVSALSPPKHNPQGEQEPQPSPLPGHGAPQVAEPETPGSPGMRRIRDHIKANAPCRRTISPSLCSLRPAPTMSLMGLPVTRSGSPGALWSSLEPVGGPQDHRDLPQP